MYLSSALRYWGEGGLIEDIDIHDNEIRMPFDPEATPWSAPAIWVRVNDPLSKNDPGREPPKTRYRDLRIRNNIIVGRIEIAHCDGVEISGNRFDRPAAEAIRVSGNCTGVRIDQA